MENEEAEVKPFFEGTWHRHVHNGFNVDQNQSRNHRELGFREPAQNERGLAGNENAKKSKGS